MQDNALPWIGEWINNLSIRLVPLPLLISHPGYDDGKDLFQPDPEDCDGIGRISRAYYDRPPPQKIVSPRAAFVEDPERAEIYDRYMAAKEIARSLREMKARENLVVDVGEKKPGEPEKEAPTWYLSEEDQELYDLAYGKGAYRKAVGEENAKVVQASYDRLKTAGPDRVQFEEEEDLSDWEYGNGAYGRAVSEKSGKVVRASYGRPKRRIHFEEDGGLSDELSDEYYEAKTSSKSPQDIKTRENTTKAAKKAEIIRAGKRPVYGRPISAKRLSADDQVLFDRYHETRSGDKSSQDKRAYEDPAKTAAKAEEGGPVKRYVYERPASAKPLSAEDQELFDQCYGIKSKSDIEKSETVKRTVNQEPQKNVRPRFLSDEDRELYDRAYGTKAVDQTDTSGTAKGAVYERPASAKPLSAENQRLFDRLYGTKSERASENVVTGFAAKVWTKAEEPLAETADKFTEPQFVDKTKSDPMSSEYDHYQNPLVYEKPQLVVDKGHGKIQIWDHIGRRINKNTKVEPDTESECSGCEECQTPLTYTRPRSVFNEGHGEITIWDSQGRSFNEKQRALDRARKIKVKQANKIHAEDIEKSNSAWNILSWLKPTTKVHFTDPVHDDGESPSPFNAAKYKSQPSKSNLKNTQTETLKKSAPASLGAYKPTSRTKEFTNSMKTANIPNPDYFMSGAAQGWGGSDGWGKSDGSKSAPKDNVRENSKYQSPFVEDCGEESSWSEDSRDAPWSAGSWRT